jgi:hypothetical protein
MSEADENFTVPPDHLWFEITDGHCSEMKEYIGFIDDDEGGPITYPHIGPSVVFVTNEGTDQEPTMGIAGGCLTCLIDSGRYKLVPVASVDPQQR